jgi:hypothetical protein
MLSEKEIYLLDKLREMHPEWICLARETREIFKQTCIASANQLDTYLNLKQSYEKHTQDFKKLDKSIAPFVKSLGYKQPYRYLSRLRWEV